MNNYPKAQAFLQRTGMTIDESLAYFERLERRGKEWTDRL